MSLFFHDYKCGSVNYEWQLHSKRCYKAPEQWNTPWRGDKYFRKRNFFLEDLHQITTVLHESLKSENYKKVHIELEERCVMTGAKVRANRNAPSLSCRGQGCMDRYWRRSHMWPLSVLFQLGRSVLSSPLLLPAMLTVVNLYNFNLRLRSKL